MFSGGFGFTGIIPNEGSNAQAVSVSPRYSGTTIIVASSTASAAEKLAAIASGGAVCDGIADDIQINAAIAVVGVAVIKFTSGFYNLNAAIVCTSKNITFWGAGYESTTFYMSANISDLFTIQGTRTQRGATGVITSATGGTKIINVNADLTASLSVGDKISIHADNVFNGKRSAFTVGEYCVIDSITASAITTVENLRYTYSAAGSRIYEYFFLENCGVDGIKFQNNLTQNEANLCTITFGNNCFIRNCAAYGFTLPRRGLFLSSCQNSIIEHSLADGILDIFGASQTGFGFSIDGGLNCLARYCVGNKNRHSVDISKGSMGTSYEAVGYNTKIYGFYCSFDVISLSTHGGCDTFEFYNNTVESPEKRFFITRGANPHWHDITVLGFTLTSLHSIFAIGEKTQASGAYFPDEYTGIAGINLIIENITGNVNLANNCYICEAVEPLQNAIIRNITLGEADETLFYLQGNSCPDGSDQTGNTFENLILTTTNPQDLGKNIIQFAAGDGATILVSGTFSDSTIYYPRDTVAPYVVVSVGTNNMVESNITIIP